jgi:hypothetical protein
MGMSGVGVPDFSIKLYYLLTAPYAPFGIA